MSDWVILNLGQSSDTLSGGEAQRVKLASFLAKDGVTDKILFIFDEPTTGLHFHDIKKLLLSFNALIEQGHSIIVIEHNMDVIKSADWLIDLGPEAGDGGGNFVYAGKPAGIKKIKEVILLILSDQYFCVKNNCYRNFPLSSITFFLKKAWRICEQFIGLCYLN